MQPRLLQQRAVATGRRCMAVLEGATQGMDGTEQRQVLCVALGLLIANTLASMSDTKEEATETLATLCVCVANQLDSLTWSKINAMKEASRGRFSS